MFCKNCGHQLKDGQKFCPSCGTAVAGEPRQETVCAEPINTEKLYTEPTPEVKQTKLNVGMLVWSILNTVFGSWLPVFGIIGLVMTVTAVNTTPESAEKKLKTAKIMNILGTILAVLIQLAGFVLAILLLSEGELTGNEDMFQFFYF